MKSKYFTVGPAAIYPGCDLWTAKFYEEGLASESHRSVIFQSIYQELDENLRILMTIPDSHAIFIANSGSEIFERILQNCVEKSSFHFVNGSFSKKFYEYALRLGFDAKIEKAQVGFSFNSMPDIQNQVELIAITHNETSTGLKVSESFIHTIKDKYPTKILAIDIVSSAPFADLDYQKVDMSFFSSQKAFGLPAGLGIWIINKDLARNLIDKNISKGAHNTLNDYMMNYVKFQTPSTPNVLAMYLMSKVAKEMNKIGRVSLNNELVEKKQFLVNLFSDNPWVQLETKLELCSDTVFNVKLLKEKSVVIHHLLRNKIICSEGYDIFKETHIRFSNFPANSWENIEYLSKVLKN